MICAICENDTAITEIPCEQCTEEMFEHAERASFSSRKRQILYQVYLRGECMSGKADFFCIYSKRTEGSSDPVSLMLAKSDNRYQPYVVCAVADFTADPARWLSFKELERMRETYVPEEPIEY